MARCGARCAIAGNNLFASSALVIERRAPDLVANTVVLRPADAGTLTDVVAAGRAFLSAVPAGALAVACEAADPDAAVLAELAVAMGAQYVHCGPLLAGSGPAILQRLLDTQHELQRRGVSVLASPPAPGFGSMILPPAPPVDVGPAQDAPADKKKKR
jgi:enolase